MPRGRAEHIVGVDFGGTKVLAAVLSTTGDILARHKVNTPSSSDLDRHVRAISSAVREALSDASLKLRSVLGIGVSVPGVVDMASGTVKLAPNLGLRDVPIAQALSKELDVPVLVANDVNLGMLGEARRGAAKGAREAVGIFVGTGIGGGVLLGGRIWEGHGSRAGEIGHMRIARDGPKCGCGGVGCLEAIASRTAVEREIRQAIAAGRPTVVAELMADRPGKIRSGVLQKAARQGDEVVD